MTNRFSIPLLAKGRVRPTGGFLLPVLFFLTGCANEGVIVRKESGPMPMYHTLGMEGSYSFYLRDKAGAVHRQIVSPDVFARYTEGDYFNDLQPVPTRAEEFDPNTVRTHPYFAKRQPTFDLKRVAKTERKTKSPQRAVAAKKRASTSRVASASASRKRPVAKAVTGKPVKAKSQQVKRATGGAKTKAIATKTRKAKSAVAKKSSPKPWKLTAPVVETAPASTTTVFAGSTAEVIPPAGEPIVSVAPDSP
ncbi:MAG TPA: hypothetical protein VG095_08850 [Chthoniobacterales bacterium]|nr:hypothetical protein [Chthoniobacterales bacterium]